MSNPTREVLELLVLPEEEDRKHTTEYRRKWWIHTALAYKGFTQLVHNHRVRITSEPCLPETLDQLALSDNEIRATKEKVVEFLQETLLDSEMDFVREALYRFEKQHQEPEIGVFVKTLAKDVKPFTGAIFYGKTAKLVIAIEPFISTPNNNI